MENNQLLEALKEDIATDGKSIKLDLYLSRSNAVLFKKHILDLLEKQREKCADEAIATEEPDYRGGTWVLVDKESITNAKLI